MYINIYTQVHIYYVCIHLLSINFLSSCLRWQILNCDVITGLSEW